MITPFGTGVTQTNEKFVWTQNEWLKMNGPLVCHKSALDGVVDCRQYISLFRIWWCSVFKLTMHTFAKFDGNGYECVQ